MAPPARSGVRDQVNSNSFDCRQWSRAEQSKEPRNQLLKRCQAALPIPIDRGQNCSSANDALQRLETLHWDWSEEASEVTSFKPNSRPLVNPRSSATACVE